MKTITFFFTALFPLTFLAQDINPVHYKKTWQDNQTRYIYGYAITKVFGQMPHSPSAYNVLPITSIAYKGLEALKKEIKKEAKENNWSNADVNSRLLELEQKAQGGMIEIYISRYQEENANFRWFFVIIRGEDDEGKVWEKEIGYQAPEVPYERGWWNYTTLQIPIELEPPFYIYLNDKQSPWLSDFKFRVENIPQGIEQDME